MELLGGQQVTLMMRRQLRHSLAPLAICICLVLAGCGLANDSASAFAARWMRELPIGPDHGWELLHPETQEVAYGNRKEAYVAEAEAANWSRVTWNVRDVMDAGNSTFSVTVSVQEKASVPAFLIKERLIDFVPVAGPEWERRADLLVVSIVSSADGTGVYLSPK